MDSNSNMCARYQNSINLETLYLSDIFADVHFRLDVSEVPAHKAILAVKSPVFQKCLDGQIDSYPMTSVATSTFLEFLQFFYMNEIRLTTTNIVGVISLVQKYEVKDALTVCEHFIRESCASDNVLSYYNMAIRFRLSTKLIDWLEEVICFDPLVILRQSGPMDLSASTTHRLFSSNNWRVSEVLILQVAVHLMRMKLRRSIPAIDCSTADNNTSKEKESDLRRAFGEDIYLIGFPLMKHEGKYV